MNHANCLRLVGKLQEALALYDSALWIEPDSYSALYNKAICYQSLNQHENALACLDKIKKIRDTDEDVMLLEGLCLCSTGRY